MLTPVTITGHLIDPTGKGATGSFRFTLSILNNITSAYDQVGLLDTDTGEMVAPLRVVGNWDDGTLCRPNGSALVLLANDDASTDPQGTVYIVHERLAAGELADWPLTVFSASPGGTLDISSQRPSP